MTNKANVQDNGKFLSRKLKSYEKLKMKELPEMERPYEKLKMFGPEKLSNAELLAIIIKTGTKTETALDLANKVLKLTNTLEELHNLSINDLKVIDGIGDVKATEIIAVCELTKRMLSYNNSAKVQIKSPEDVFKIFSYQMKFLKNEVIKAVILNTKNVIVKIQDVAVGDVNCSHVTMKMILSENIRLQEPKLILVHNHPSGNPEPSESDILLTDKLIEAGKILGIELLDHVVIGNGCYKSIFSINHFKNVKL